MPNGGRCCCTHPVGPVTGPSTAMMDDCRQVLSKRDCPELPNCFFNKGAEDPCVLSTLVESTLVTPFGEHPDLSVATSDLYQSMDDVAALLARSEMGRRVIAYASEFVGETAALVGDDPELRSRAFRTLMIALGYARAMEREWLRPGSTSPDWRFRDEDFAFGDALAADIQQRTDNPALVAAIDDLREQAARFVGLSAAGSLGVLFGGSTPA
jgi:hypothetical protein